MSTLQASNLKNASSASTNITLDTSGNATVAGTMAMGSSFLRNRIINGDMRIDQRNAGAAVSVTAGGYVIDRFSANVAAGTVTAQRSTTAPTGFTNSFLVSVTTGASPTSGQVGSLFQAVEGLNCSDFGFGTASAQTVTLSFWVRSSVTGTYGVAFRNSAVNRCYVASYTVNSANTWEYKTVTIAGDTSGTWLTDTGVGIYVSWDLGEGSTRSTSTTGSWLAANTPGLSTGTKLCATTGATFYITGVQLEAGTVATPFERRLYGQELALCQRYYEVSGAYNIFSGYTTSGNYFYHSCRYAVTKRANPTVTTINSSNANFPAVDPSVVSLTDILQAYKTANATGGGGYFAYSWKSDAEL